MMMRKYLLISSVAVIMFAMQENNKVIAQVSEFCHHCWAESTSDPLPSWCSSRDTCYQTCLELQCTDTARATCPGQAETSVCYEQAYRRCYSKCL